MRPRLDFDVLVPLAQLGDKKALDELASFIYFHGLTVTKRRFPNTSHELRMAGINQVVIRLLDGTLLANYRGECTLLPFVYRAFENAVRDEERKDRLRRKAERSYDTTRHGGDSWRDRIPDTAPGPDRDTMARLELEYLLPYMTEQEIRITVALTEGVSRESIARSEGMSVAALKMTVSRMRKRLNQHRGEWNDRRQESSSEPVPVSDLPEQTSEDSPEVHEGGEPYDFIPDAGD